MNKDTIEIREGDTEEFSDEKFEEIGDVFGDIFTETNKQVVEVITSYAESGYEEEAHKALQHIMYSFCDTLSSGNATHFLIPILHLAHKEDLQELKHNNSRSVEKPSYMG